MIRGTTAIVKDGLVLCLDAANTKSYPKSGTSWYDLSRNNNTGTLTNGPTFSSANSGNIVFDGIDDYVLGSTISSISGNASRTVSIWVKSAAAANVPLFDIGTTGAINQAHQLYLAYLNSVGSSPPVNNGGIYIAFWGNDIFYPLNYTSLFDGNWHYIAYSYNSATTTLQLCVDGNFGNTAYLWNSSTWTTFSSQPFSLATSLNTVNNQYYVGYTRSQLWSAGTSYGNSSVSSLLLHNRALSSSEILQNYNATRTRFGIS